MPARFATTGQFFFLPICIFDVMIDNFKQFILKEELFHPSDYTLLAVSGGMDSVVMASLFHQAGYHFGIAHANFGLRGAESGRDELFVRSLAEKYKVKVFVKHFETAKFARSHKLSVQVAARQLRYEWFDELQIKYGYDQVATAHHLDDQVETFLINLTRGTGIAGLHGILPRQGKIIRPMMFTDRQQIEAYARENRLEYVEDSSNRSVKYTRNRIRHKVIPQLERINPALRQELTQTISFIRDAEKIYNQTIERKRREIFHERGDQIYIQSDQFFCLEPLTSWAYELLSPYGFNLSNIRDIACLADAIPGKEVRSTTFRLLKDREYLIIAPLEETGKEATFMVSMYDLKQKSIRSPLNLEFEILHEIPAEYSDPGSTAYIDLDKLDFPVTIRKWQKGDFFYPLGMSQRKKLSDFFTDQKFSRIEKEKKWLLCSGKKIVWIIGHRIDDRFKITSSSKKILKITLNPDSLLPD
ncbi:MAG: tRNA lysidine(34) synthetase TilS [Bacteroidales bacterium]|nr:tRNA lysidine(34) synthetase TilS [Bacteroidales bacterium]